MKRILQSIWDFFRRPTQEEIDQHEMDYMMNDPDFGEAVISELNKIANEEPEEQFKPVNNQQFIVLNHLSYYNHISDEQALGLGIKNISSVVTQLRKRSHNIVRSGKGYKLMTS